MGRFGSQTSTYNRLVIIFVAIGSLVSRILVLILTVSTLLTQLDNRHMATARLSSAVPSVNPDGITTSTCP